LINTIMEHPVSRERVALGSWFSFPCLVFGPAWFAWKRMFGTALLAAVGVVLTLMWGWLVLPFIANPMLRRHLTKRGFVEVSAPAPSTRVAHQAPIGAEAPQAAARTLWADVASVPVDLGACMDCGSRDELEAREFGLARILDVNYAAMTATAGISAISMLLGGPGMVKGPKTTASIVRGQLVLCQRCLGRRKNFIGLPRIADKDYALHPWAAAARRHGYTTYLDRYALARYKSVK